MTTNCFGLSRNIPAHIRREIRQRSKFGCVICRCAVYQYEHINPNFADATEHDPSKMCLLCGRCHDQVTRGRLSKQTVQSHYLAIQNCTTTDRPFEHLDLYTSSVTIHIGSAIFEQPRTLFKINGEPILAITPSHDGEAFPSLNGAFYDSNQQELLRIEDNVWFAQNSSWDIEISGTSLTILTAPGDIALRLELAPPNIIRITHLNLYKDNCHIFIHDGELLIGHINGANASYLGLANFHCLSPETAISVDTNGVTSLAPTGISIVGGKGIKFNGTGIHVGDGASGMYLQKLKFWNC